MKIISQNKMVDLQYENHVIVKICMDHKWHIRAYSPHLNDLFWELGEYDTKEDAENEIERILLKFSENFKVYRMSRPKSTKKAQN